MCGVLGLRPTVGRSATTHCPATAYSAATFGAVAGTAADVTLVHAVIANAGEPLQVAISMSGVAAPGLVLVVFQELLARSHACSPTRHLSCRRRVSRQQHESCCAGVDASGGPPAATIPRQLCRPGQAPQLTGLRLGIFRPWFQHADAEIVAACSRAVACLEHLGARVSPALNASPQAAASWSCKCPPSSACRVLHGGRCSMLCAGGAHPHASAGCCKAGADLDHRC